MMHHASMGVWSHVIFCFHEKYGGMAMYTLVDVTDSIWTRCWSSAQSCFTLLLMSSVDYGECFIY